MEWWEVERERGGVVGGNRERGGVVGGRKGTGWSGGR